MTDDLEWCRAFIDHNCTYRSPPGELTLRRERRPLREL
jgi:hypothetical protein